MNDLTMSATMSFVHDDKQTTLLAVAMSVPFS